MVFRNFSVFSCFCFSILVCFQKLINDYHTKAHGPWRRYFFRFLSFFFNSSANENRFLGYDRLLRDSQDIQKICSWFSEHPPFIHSTRVVSISRGIIGEDVNCHEAYSVGSLAMSNAFNKRFGEVKVKRSEGVTL